MATKSEKEIRLELPSTNGVECSIRENLSREEYVLTFFQNERKLKSFAISQSQLNQDKMVDILSDAGVEFFSFSAIFDVADLLIESIKEEFRKELLFIEDKPSKETEKKRTLIEDETPISDKAKTVSDELLESIKAHKKVSVESGDKLLKKFEMPYSQSGYAAIYFCRDGQYAVALYQKNNLVIRKKFSRENVNQDDLVAMISESGIDFLSFSSIYDTAEEIEKIILHPEELVGQERVDEPLIPDLSTVKVLDDYKEVIQEPRILEAEIVTVDLSALDTSKFKKAEDFDKFITKVKEFVNEGQPLPVKEIEIPKSGGVICLILRKMDSWFLQFKQKDGSLSVITEVKIDQDEIARTINNAVPQISFSYLYDASENIYKVMEQLVLRPIDEIVFNVAVGHFMDVIEQYESENDFKAAAKVTEVLFKRFKKEGNTRGILQFGKKLVYYLEVQKKTSQALKRRNELVEELLEIDVDIANNFVMESLDILDAQEKYLNAANLCGLILDQYLADEENYNTLNKVLILARKQVDLYKKARLPVVLSENAERYAHFAIRQLAKAKELQLPEDQIHLYKEEIDYLLDMSLEAFEKRKATFELLESLEKTLNVFKEANYKYNYSKYASRFIISCETQDQKKKALEVAIKSTELLMDNENFPKACEFGNQAIRLFYDLSKIEEAVEFSLSIVHSLLELKESSAATDYLKFVENLIEKAYENDETRRIEKQLLLGDLFGKLGMQDRSKVYVQTALQAIKDQKKREKIVLKYVTELFSKNAVLTAQEMANLELSRLLNDKKIDDVINFCKSFIEKLKAHQQTEMVFEYMKYVGNLMIQADHSDYNTLLSFINETTDSKEIDKAAFIVDLLVTLQLKKEDNTRAIDTIGNFLNYLIGNTNRFDLIQRFIQKTTEAYHRMGDPEGAVERLIGFQKELLDHSLDLAQRITDIVLKELEKNEDFKGSIDVVSRLIDKQMELKNYQDAYIYSVQSARYYERLGDIESVIKYLEKMRDRFIEYEQYEDASRMTDLILRFGRSHKETKLAINALKNYSKTALDIGDTETATKFTLELASLLEEDDRSKKALEYLQMVFNRIYQQDKESSYLIFQRIIKIRGQQQEFKKLCKDYLEPLLMKNLDYKLIEKVKQVLNPPIDEFSQFSEKIYDYISDHESISDDIAEAIVDFVKLVYKEGENQEGDRLGNKYARIMLDAEKVSYASSLMAVVLNYTKGALSEVLPASFKYIQGLIDNSLLEAAREYTDRVINMISIEKKLGNEGRLLSAKLAEKFAGYVAGENPDLASEYAYQAADYYRQLNDFESVIHVYINLAEKFSSIKHAIRILKRGIHVCKKYNAKKYEAVLLAKLTSYLILSHNETSLNYFQQTLERFEELQDLDALFNTVISLLENIIESNNLEIAFSYLDYSTRLSSMINKAESMGGILLFLLRHVENLKDREKVELINKYFIDLDLKPKKYKKEYESLMKRQKAYLKERFEPEEEFEPELIPPPEPKLAPEIKMEEEPEVRIVDTSQIVSPTDIIPVLEPSLESIEEVSEEEVVDAIKTFEQDQIIAPEAPSLEEVEQVIEPEPEITRYEPKIKQEDTALNESKVLEIPIREDAGVPQKTALSDDEIETLFSLKEPADEISTISEKEIPLESVPQDLKEVTPKVDIPSEKRVSLSDDEVRSLFAIEEKAPSEDAEIEEEPTSDEEWEVDSFGRLWKKGTISSSAKEEIPLDDEVSIDVTPDLSPLEKLLEKEDETDAIEPSLVGGEEVIIGKESEVDVLEEALQETKFLTIQKSEIDSTPPISEEGIFDKKTADPFASVVSSLTEDEESDPFMMPEVSYQEISKEDSGTDSQVKPPELAELFSSALSELSGISGEKGESAEKKKKK
ncbi:MAG: hypothetical protein ACFFAU_09495 [Candidatus Hodarchaeota archaeon]